MQVKTTTMMNPRFRGMATALSHPQSGWSVVEQDAMLKNVINQYVAVNGRKIPSTNIYSFKTGTETRPISPLVHLFVVHGNSEINTRITRATMTREKVNPSRV